MDQPGVLSAGIHAINSSERVSGCQGVRVSGCQGVRVSGCIVSTLFVWTSSLDITF